MKILIAEDDPVSRKLMQSFLGPYGQCELAGDGLETLEAFVLSHHNGEPFDLLCLDIMMPKLDGLKVLKTLRSIEKDKGIPEDKKIHVIMTSALYDRKTVREAYDSGCGAYLWKPIMLEKLQEAVASLGLKA